MAKKLTIKAEAKPGAKPGAKALKAVKALKPATNAKPPVAVAAAVEPDAPAGAAVLDRLFAVITARRKADPAFSHSARLLARGRAKVAQKFGEEAVECLIEAVTGDKAAMVAESADVLYHLLVMWVATGVTPGQVWTELQSREGVSGVAEKAARAAKVLGTRKIP